MKPRNETERPVKLRKLFAAASLSIGLAFSANAQSALIDGQVTKIDVPAKRITIKHGPIKKLGMDEGMTMVFRVPDESMLAGIKAGDKIKFDADNANGQFTVIKVEKAK